MQQSERRGLLQQVLSPIQMSPLHMSPAQAAAVPDAARSPSFARSGVLSPAFTGDVTAVVAPAVASPAGNSLLTGLTDLGRKTFEGLSMRTPRRESPAPAAASPKELRTMGTLTC